MTRSGSSLVAAIVASAIGAAGCDQADADSASADDPEVGVVSMAFTLSETVTVASIEYRLSGNGIAPIVGTIDVSGPASTPTAAVGGFPAGAGFLAEMHAISTDGLVSCAGSNTFDVQARATSPVMVILQCRGPDRGGVVVVSGGFNSCPQFASYSGSPVTVSVGGTISLAAVAMDDDSAALSYVWTASAPKAGTFADSAAANTTFTCRVPGALTLTVTASDGMCQDSAAIPVVCAPFCAGRADGTPCDDGDACTGIDRCSGGKCAGTAPTVCVATDACHQQGVCDPQTGRCSNPPAVDGAMCVLPNSSAACTATTCGVVSCSTGFGDCNARAVDGCEVSLLTSPDHCGACGRTCPAGATCAAGHCLSPAPSTVSASAGGWRVGLTWTSVAGATSYEVLRAPVGSTSFQTVGTSTATSFVDQAIPSSGSFSYAVSTRSEGGSSARSSAVPVTPLPKQICISSDSTHAVLAFDATQTGAVAPIRTISGANTGFGFPKGLAANLGNGELFVSLLGGEVPVFSLAAAGNVPPLRTLVGGSPGQTFNLLALDGAHSEIFTADFTAGGSVVVLDTVSGLLKRTITGSATQLLKPDSAAIDGLHGELLVGQLDATSTSQQILTFSSAASGNATPLRVLGGAGNSVGGFAIAYDPGHDEVFTSCDCNGRVDVYPRTASGNALPSRTMTVSTLVSVYSILLDQGNDTLWLLGNAGFGSFQLWEVPRGTTGVVAPLHAPITINATGGRLAPCN